MDKKNKIISLYKYVKEISALKYNVVTDINKQYWAYFLKDIPEDPDNITLYYRDRTEEDEKNDNMILLEVRKPEFQRCPEPPDSIVEWLEPGWDKYTNDPKIKDKIYYSVENLPNDEEENNIMSFDSSSSRIRLFEKWKDSRNLWVDRQRIINRTRQFFAQLYQAYTDIERDSEILEFVVGNGLIQNRNNMNINHPILTKRVKFDFDAKKNIIKISDTDTEPELYTLLLQDMSEINHGVIRVFKEELRENFYHPLDRNDTPDFLKALTHGLCSESKFIINEDGQPEPWDMIITWFSSVFFIRKRIDGTLKSIEEIIANIENTGYVPGHIIDLVGGNEITIPIDDREYTIEEQLAAISGESIDILLSKEANREQLEIAERIQLHNAVLVQGPPGTGKTHTIANLLGHFLAQGKSVLVTSHTKKALSVLKAQVPEAIQNLCVSILEDTNNDMIRSIDGISEYLSKYTSNELKRKIESSARERIEIIKRLSDVRRKIYAIKYHEFEPIVYNGESYSPTTIAKFVNKYAEELSYIPGQVRLIHPLPVSIDELHLLYRSNESITSEVESELDHEIPDPEFLITPAEFAKNIHIESKGHEILEQLGMQLNLILKYDLEKSCIITECSERTTVIIDNPTDQGLNELETYINSFNSIDDWMIQVAIDGHKGGNFRRKWEILISSIEETASYAESIIPLMLGQKIIFAIDVDYSVFKLQLLKLFDIFQKKGRISKLDFLFNKKLESALSLVSINGKNINSADDCNIVLSYISLMEKRAKTRLLWDELMGNNDALVFDTLGTEPEEICKQMIPNIKRYLDWYQNEYDKLIKLINKAGLNSKELFDYSDLDSAVIRAEKMLKSIRDIIPLHIQVAKIFIQLDALHQRRQHLISILSEGNRKKSAICIETASALCAKETDRYEESYLKLSNLYSKYALQKNRIDILDKIKPLAPDWANAITNREGIHGEKICPGNIEQAWKWKQFVGIIDEMTAEPFEDLQKDSVKLSENLRATTAEYAANKAWYHLLLRTERNLEMKQALGGWKLTIKKIGKGTGKNAPALRRQARDLMAKCQNAVPAWIMPVGKALETLEPSKNQFDVVIVDEASQSDISSLAIMYMAKKVIIVGDDKQVSPMAIGMDVDRINALQEMYIKDTIPNWHLYDAKTSLYDIAGTTFQPLMLREHFRCVPDIIGYSNKLSYDFKIKPLRDSGTSLLSPPVVQYRVLDGQRKGTRKINTQEAEAVVSLMIACMEQPEYEHETFGVISLLGDDQVKLIQQIIFRRIGLDIIEKRRILCGNAAHFQGDERGVIFLSMVDSNEGEGQLRMSGEGVDQSTKQRYNVAGSRAKNQLWIIHSLDYSKDLKNGDMRRDLLEYAENPQAYSRLVELVGARAESPFEEEVAKSLIAAGFNVVQQWEVGAYRIDMVVQYKDNKIAIECDGEMFHSGEEKIRADMERQIILERLGWRFIRIRGSEYYRDPESSILRVIDELTKNGVLQEKSVAHEADINSSELLSRVKIRAAQILTEWHSAGEDERINDLIAIDERDYISKKNTNAKAIKNSLTPYSPKNEINNIAQNQGEYIVKSNDEQNEIIRLDKKIETLQEPQKISDRLDVLKVKDIKTGKNLDNIDKEVKVNLIKNKKDFFYQLEQEKISYIDNSSQSGIIWIPFSDEIKEIVESTAKNSGYKINLDKRGAISTGNKPAWRIMIK